ncbi:MAG: hypothetical protein KGI08_02575 [Thaumarchaeota archaeon]|nr:hypothetical protein [Nitrososphaerota archaeon]
MSTPKKYFEVTVAGQYIALMSSTGTQTLKNYEEKFILPTQEAALSKICKHLLSPRLKKKYADFIKFRTHEKIAVKLFNYTPDPAVLQMAVDDMNLTELSDFCILRGLEIDPVLHGHKDIFAIRQMVQKANDEKRQALKDKQTSKNHPEEKEANVLRQMNDLEKPPEGLQINLNEQLVHKERPVQEAPTLPAVPTTAEPLEADEPLPPIEKDNDDPFTG